MKEMFHSVITGGVYPVISMLIFFVAFAGLSMNYSLFPLRVYHRLSTLVKYYFQYFLVALAQANSQPYI